MLFDHSILNISIHALHEESDVRGGVRAERGEFQSTLSMRRATGDYYDLHNLLTRFQSTLSMRRATCAVPMWSSAARFQSTLSMRRATISLPSRRRAVYFNPRSP